MKKLQSDAWIAVLPADKGSSTATFEHSLEKCRDHINNGPNQLPKKDPSTKVKAKKGSEGQRAHW